MPQQIYTRCPDCSTVFRVTEQHLKLAKGRVRCGACLSVFKATDHLVRPKESPSPSPQITKTQPKPDPEPAKSTIERIQNSIEINEPKSDSAPSQSQSQSPSRHNQALLRADAKVESDLHYATSDQNPKTQYPIESFGQNSPAFEITESHPDLLDEHDEEEVPADSANKNDELEESIFLDDHEGAEWPDEFPMPAVPEYAEELEDEAEDGQPTDEDIDAFISEIEDADTASNKPHSERQANDSFDLNEPDFSEKLPAQHPETSNESAENFSEDESYNDYPEDDFILEASEDEDPPESESFSGIDTQTRGDTQRVPKVEDPYGELEGAVTTENDSQNTYDFSIGHLNTHLKHGDLAPDPLGEFDDMVEAKSHRLKWLILGLGFTLIVIWGGWTLWSDRQTLAWDDTWGSSVQLMCDLLPCDLQPRRDVAAIELIQRSVRPNEDNPNLSEFSLMIRNNAAFEQPFPSVKITFTDTTGVAVSEQIFTPDRYLSDEMKATPMPANQKVHILIMTENAQSNAFGFEFSFL